MDTNDAPIEDDLDPIIAAVLEQLWTASRESPGKPWSLAKLSKRGNLTMSALRRALTALKWAELVDFDVQDDGRGHATPSPVGVELCAEIFGTERVNNNG